MSHGVVRTDLMAATDVRGGASLVSVRYQPSDKKTAVDNGNVVLLNGLEDGEREIYKGATPTAASPLEDIVLVASPEVMYDEHKHNLDEFENEAGVVARGYHLHQNDVFSVTADALTATNPAVGNVVELAAATKLKVVASATSGSTRVGTIIAIETAGRYTYYVIKVD